MKKVILILLLGVFTLGSSGFKANENEDSQDCLQYAVNAVYAENEVYGNQGFWANVSALSFYYDLCEEVNDLGGTALQPVFVR